MTSKKIDENLHIIETDYKVPTKYGYEDRFSFQVYQGKIEFFDHPYFNWTLGMTIEQVEQWVVDEEVRRKLELHSMNDNVAITRQQQEIRWKEDNEKQRKMMEAKYGDKELKDFYNN